MRSRAFGGILPRHPLQGHDLQRASATSQIPPRHCMFNVLSWKFATADPRSNGAAITILRTRRREGKVMTDMMRELRAEELDNVSGGGFGSIGSSIAQTSGGATVTGLATEVYYGDLVLSACPAGMICT
jgi:hypothetical protein